MLRYTFENDYQSRISLTTDKRLTKKQIEDYKEILGHNTTYRVEPVNNDIARPIRCKSVKAIKQKLEELG